jgi:expansin (peptidoglycan-binding protein)
MSVERECEAEIRVLCIPKVGGSFDTSLSSFWIQYFQIYYNNFLSTSLCSQAVILRILDLRGDDWSLSVVPVVSKEHIPSRIFSRKEQV